MQSSIMVGNIFILHGQPMRFYLPSFPRRNEYIPRIESHGGIVVDSYAGSLPIYTLLPPDLPPIRNILCYQLQLIDDSLREGSLQPLTKFIIRSLPQPHQHEGNVKRVRIEYTKEDDEKMTEYIRNSGATSVYSNALFIEMGEKKVTEHSWQSMKNRYTKRLLPLLQQKKEETIFLVDKEDLQMDRYLEKQALPSPSRIHPPPSKESSSLILETATVAPSSLPPIQPSLDDSSHQETLQSALVNDERFLSLRNCVKQYCIQLGVVETIFLHALYVMSGDFDRALRYIQNQLMSKELPWTNSEDELILHSTESVEWKLLEQKRDMTDIKDRLLFLRTPSY